MEDYIIIPTYNERENIPVLLDQLITLYPTTHIMIVDDNSPDGTGDIIKDYARRFHLIELYGRPGKFGLGTAYIEAFNIILGRPQNIRSIITMDADFSHDPKVVEEMHRLIDMYDVIIGSRYMQGGHIAHWPLWRKILSRFGNFYARTITGTPIADMTSGFHCFRADILRRYHLKKITSAGFAFLIEIKIIGYRMGASIKETPIVLKDRKEGKTKLSNHIIYEAIILPWRWWIPKNNY